MIRKRPTDFIREKKNRLKELENFRRMSGNTEEWMINHAKEVQKIYSAGGEITRASEDESTIELDIDLPVDPVAIAQIAFDTGKTTIVNVNFKEENMLENNTPIDATRSLDNIYNIEDMAAPINLESEELNYEEVVVNQADIDNDYEEIGMEEDSRSGLRKFWDFMNKPYYVRTLFGFKAPTV